MKCAITERKVSRNYLLIVFLCQNAFEDTVYKDPLHKFLSEFSTKKTITITITITHENYAS